YKDEPTRCTEEPTCSQNPGERIFPPPVTTGHCLFMTPLSSCSEVKKHGESSLIRRRFSPGIVCWISAVARARWPYWSSASIPMLRSLESIPTPRLCPAPGAKQLAREFPSSLTRGSETISHTPSQVLIASSRHSCSTICPPRRRVKLFAR